MPQGTFLTIGDLAERTGVPAMTLRSWEARYAALRPERGPTGHRRYRPDDVAFVQEVVRLRSTGLSTAVAVQRAGAERGRRSGGSLFGGLRAAYPHLAVHLLDRRTMLAMSRAMEDECLARAGRPVLFGFFQKQRFYGASARRWDELSRTASVAVVFAEGDEGSSGATGGAPVRVPLAEESPAVREWAVICDASDVSACLVGWERPHSGGHGRGERVFEAVWSVEPSVVRLAARASVDLLAPSHPETAARLRGELAGEPPDASSDLRRATGVLDRFVDYIQPAPRGATETRRG